MDKKPTAKAHAASKDVAASGDALELHQGQALHRAANTYNTLPAAMLEMVQNALDAGATTVFIAVTPNKQVIVLDDGEGVTPEKFGKALRSVGHTIKPKKGTLGRFGLGLVSPLNKCNRYLFISQAEGQKEIFQWTFVGEELRKQARDITIPRSELERWPQLTRRFAATANGLGAKWRTMVRMDGLVENRAVSHIDPVQLEGEIRRKFGFEMHRRGTTVHVVVAAAAGSVEHRVVNPATFDGQPLTRVIYHGSDCGKVEFEIYLAPKRGGKPSGQVLVMEWDDNYPVTWQEFRIQAIGRRLYETFKESFEAIGSGFFEGIIRAEGIELAPERNKFELSDALDALYLVINDWYSDHGQAYLEDETEASRMERHREQGKQVWERIHDLFSDKYAHIGQRLFGLLPDQAQADEALERKQRQRQSDSSAKPKRPPAVVRNPRPKRDRSDDSVQPPDAHGFTLNLAYDVLPGSPYLWEFDPASATLTFNIRHPDWVTLDETNGRHTAKNDRQIMHLQEYLTLKVLMALSRHGSLYECDMDAERVAIDEEVGPYVALFIQTAKTTKH